VGADLQGLVFLLDSIEHHSLHDFIRHQNVARIGIPKTMKL
jgi:hypothetical protein